MKHINMSASPKNAVAGELPKSVSFNPAGKIDLPAQSNVEFVVDNSLLSYIACPSFKVSFSWNSSKKELKNGDPLSYSVGKKGEDTYILSISLQQQNQSHGNDDENAATTSGEIIVK